MGPNTVVTVNTTFELFDHTVVPEPVGVELRYGLRDPYAVVIAVDSSDHPLEWHVARDLLTTGLTTPSGESDITIRPAAGSPDRLVLEFRGRVLHAETRRVAHFLDLTYEVVREGEEGVWLDIDRELAKLVSSD